MFCDLSSFLHFMPCLLLAPWHCSWTFCPVSAGSCSLLILFGSLCSLFWQGKLRAQQRTQDKIGEGGGGTFRSWRKAELYTLSNQWTRLAEYNYSANWRLPFCRSHMSSFVYLSRSILIGLSSQKKILQKMANRVVGVSNKQNSQTFITRPKPNMLGKITSGHGFTQ